MLRKLILASLCCSLGLFYLAPQLGAQVIDPTTLHEVCTGSTTCTPGATTLITGSSLPTFDITIQGQTGFSGTGGTGDLYLLIFVPGTNNLSFTVDGISAVKAGSFSSSSTSQLWSDAHAGFFAAQNLSTANPNLSAFISASGQSGITPTSMTVYVVNLGNKTLTGLKNGSLQGNVVTLASITTYGGISAFPKGTVFFSALSNCASCSLASGSTNVINSTPLSESITTVPEPSTLVFLGSGLLGIGVWLRRALLG